MKNQSVFPGKTRSVILFFLLSLFSSVSLAATYYISPTGNDITGNGTSANPWRTLRKATQTVTSSGNIIYVNAGTYIETQTSFLAVGVSIDGAGTANTIIKGGMTGQFSTLLALDSPNDTNGNQSVSNITFDGQYVSETVFVTSIGLFVTGRSNVQIYNCRIINFRNRGVIFDGNDANDPVLDPGHYATGNKFYNNTVLNSAENNGSFGTGLLNIGSQMGMEIYGNTMIQDQRPDFRNGWPIKPWNNGWLKGVKIYNNILTKAPYRGSFPGQNGDWDFCLEFINVEGLEIYNNTIQGSVDLNFSRKGAYAFSAWIHHNNIGRSTLNSNFESGILLEFRTESILIEHNIINNVSTAIQFNTRSVNENGGFPNPGGGTPAGGFSYLLNNTIRNNLMSNLYVGDGSGGAGGIVITSESGNDQQINGLNIYNNTIVAKAGDNPAVGLNFSNQQNGNATNINIRNNIVIGFTYTWLAGSQPTPAMSNVIVTHNDAFGNANGNAPHWPGGVPSAYTYNNNLSVDPQFVSATDFHLRLNSPVIDRGIDVGIPYFGNAPDMGYAEFNPGGPVPIKLVEFNVRRSGSNNILYWTTATESNSDHFDIERSSDGQSWMVIGRVNAAGSSTSEIKYDFADATPVRGMNYYRLAMIDKNGATENSRIVSISSEASNNVEISYLDLSSASGTATIKINSPQAQNSGLTIIDMGGRTVFNSTVYLQQGSNVITKNVPGLLPAIYYVRVSTASGVVVKKAFSRN
jgi:hypothetical protein